MGRFCVRKAAAALTAIAFGLTASSAFATQLLTNPGFDTPTPGLTPPTYFTSITGLSGGVGAVASAEGWGLYNNTAGTTTSELLPTIDPAGSGYMIHVTTPGAADGLYQFFTNASSHPTASVDLYVLSGVVNLEYWNNGGNTFLGSVSSTTTNQWQTLSLALTGVIPTEIVIYDGNSGSAFYADNASVISVPEPATLSLGLVGAAALRLRRARAKASAVAG